METRDMTVSELSAHLGLHANTVRRLINQGVIPAYRAGLRAWRIEPAALDAIKASGGVRRQGRPSKEGE